jgi:small subunit ribosomal protein S3
VGQKANPYGLRLGIIKTWKSRWIQDKKNFGKALAEDIRIREHIEKTRANAGISMIEIERSPENIKIIIHTARPGIVIGRRGTEIDRLREEIREMSNKEIYIDVKEVKEPNANAQLVAGNIAFQLVKRVSYRRSIKKALYNAMNAGAEGIRVSCAGRLGGAEMSRRVTYKEGSVPLHTLRADIDYGFAEARTTYGTIGVKVWIYKGEILPEAEEDKEAKKEEKEKKK